MYILHVINVRVHVRRHIISCVDGATLRPSTFFKQLLFIINELTRVVRFYLLHSVTQYVCVCVCARQIGLK